MKRDVDRLTTPVTFCVFLALWALGPAVVRRRAIVEKHGDGH